MATTKSEVVLNTGQQAIINTDTGKIFVGSNRYDDANYVNNSSYGSLTLQQGTVMGRVSSSKVLKPCSAQSVDGSQIPLGILAHDVLVLQGATKNVTICVAGDVVESRVLFFLGDTLDTLVGGARIYRDLIGAETVGINLVPTTDSTGYDNQ